MKRLVTATIVAAALAGFGVSCGTSRASAGAWLSGVPTDDLTSTERADLERYLRTFPPPCAGAGASLGQCLEEKRDCRSCGPAAVFVTDAIRSGRSSAQVEAVYLARFDPELVKQIDIAGAPVKGPATAPVTIVEFADYQCPACAAAVGILDRVVAGYAPHVRLVFKHYPLPYHTSADLAARAAVAASRQARFWELHHTMFRNRTALQAADVDTYAAQVGLDMARFHADLESPAVRETVARDRAQGEALDLQGTPTVFINGREFSFELFDFSGEDLLDWLELEIELATGQKVKRPAAPAAPSATASAAAEPPSPVKVEE